MVLGFFPCNYIASEFSTRLDVQSVSGLEFSVLPIIILLTDGGSEMQSLKKLLRASCVKQWIFKYIAPSVILLFEVNLWVQLLKLKAELDMKEQVT